MFDKIKQFLESGRIQELLFPIGVAASIVVILIPLDGWVVDILLSLNITIAVVILLTTVFVSKPLDFNIFPTVLLATTLFRLVLSIATTRLILSNAGTDGMLAAGKVIKSFSEFVSGNNVVVGFIIFAIIVVIQFVVITKGSTRVAEVAARFTLDAMPGRQMAIDADLNAGIIDEREAKRRREEITDSADFFGAMDGASKFVRGDAIAGIVIIFINILGGLFIGVIQHGIPLMQALSLYTRLTIGDGLVSQVPAFLISLATGLLVTRSSQSSNLPKLFFSQIVHRPIVLVLASGFLLILTFTSLPRAPLVTLSLCGFGLAFLMNKNFKQVAVEEKVKQAEKEDAEKKPEERIEDFLVIDPMELELGVGLISLADPGRGGDLLDRLHRLRQSIASEIGIILPRVRIRDSFQLDNLQYRMKIAGQPVALGMVYPEMYLAIDPGEAVGEVQGIQTTDPAFGSPAIWIDEATKDQAELYGYTVVEPGAVIATHLQETVRKHADELLTRDATQHLLNELKQATPAVVDELITPNGMTLGQVQQILQMLLREQVPIRQLGTILETLGDYATRTRDPFLLTEHVRAKLARALCTKYRDLEDTLHVAMLDPSLEDQIRAGFEWNAQGIAIRFTPQAIAHLCGRISQELEKLTQANHPPIVIVNPQIRPALKLMTAAEIPHLIVLCYNEITRDTKVDSIGMVTL